MTATPADRQSHCAVCNQLIEAPSQPHAKGSCNNCGRDFYRLAGPNGLEAKQGEQIVFPAGTLSLSLDPNEGNGRLLRPGFTWLIQHLVTESAPNKPTDVRSALEKYNSLASHILKASSMLSDFNLETEEGAEAAIERLGMQQHLVEWWAMAMGTFAALTEEHLNSGKTEEAVWAMSQTEVCRSVLFFMRSIEPLAWRGYNSAGLETLEKVLKIWQDERSNKSENFWQETLTDNSLVLSQVFHAPLVLSEGQAYIGGKRLDGTGGKEVDFLLTNAVLGTGVIIEIKTPASRLLGTRYREDVYGPSAELSGAIAQALRYRETLTRHYKDLRAEDPRWESVDPLCAVIAGDATKQLDSRAKRESFELYRRSLKNVEILTYDELFAKVEHLVSAMRLGRS
ncbi:hypothetical protein GCM10027612_08760 [Microbispora bryophytorum subsp. camponoti]